jgi:D-amino peptidase
MRMKIMIAADMEGITGVVHWDQVSSKHPEYTRFRQLMTRDVNAAVRGVFEGGADEVVVSDGHSAGRNILIEELDSRARLNSGTPSPFSMVQGIDESFSGVIFVGNHARIGTPQAILEHTWSDERVANLELQGKPFGESGLNGALCGHFGVPVIMVTGDQAVCTEAQDFFPGIETAAVKKASGRMAAELLPPAVTEKMIQETAKQAVKKLALGAAPKPLQLEPPIQFAIDFVQSEMADKAALMPGATRIGRRIEYTAPDMPTLYRAFRSLIMLASG